MTLDEFIYPMSQTIRLSLAMKISGLLYKDDSAYPKSQAVKMSTIIMELPLRWPQSEREKN